MTTKQKILLLIGANTITLLIKMFAGPGIGYYAFYNVPSLPVFLLLLIIITSSVFYVLLLKDYWHYSIIKRTVPALLFVMTFNHLVSPTSVMVLVLFLVSLATFVYLGIYTATHYNNRYMLHPLTLLAGIMFINNIGFYLFYTWPLQILLADFFVIYRILLLVAIYAVQVLAYYKVSDMHIANTHRKTIEYNE